MPSPKLVLSNDSRRHSRGRGRYELLRRVDIRAIACDRGVTGDLFRSERRCATGSRGQQRCHVRAGKPCSGCHHRSCRNPVLAGTGGLCGTAEHATGDHHRGRHSVRRSCRSADAAARRGLLSCAARPRAGPHGSAPGSQSFDRSANAWRHAAWRGCDRSCDWSADARSFRWHRSDHRAAGSSWNPGRHRPHHGSADACGSRSAWSPGWNG